jgi:hypothetical protein
MALTVDGPGSGSGATGTDPESEAAWNQAEAAATVDATHKTTVASDAVSIAEQGARV